MKLVKAFLKLLQLAARQEEEDVSCRAQPSASSHAAEGNRRVCAI